MKYSLSNELHKRQLRTRFEKIMQKQSGIVELKEVKKGRTLSQNAYLHVCISYFALQVGETADYVKSEYYKIAANRPYFEYEAEDKLTGKKVTRLRSSAALSTEELTVTIEKFRNWAASVAGIYIPSPEDNQAIEEMQMEIERYNKYT